MASTGSAFLASLTLPQLKSALGGRKPVWAISMDTGALVYANAAAAKAFGYSRICDLLASPPVGLSGERPGGRFSPAVFAGGVAQLRIYRGVKSVTLMAHAVRETLADGTALFVVETEAGSRRDAFTAASLIEMLEGTAGFAHRSADGAWTAFGDAPQQETGDSQSVAVGDGDALVFADPLAASPVVSDDETAGSADPGAAELPDTDRPESELPKSELPGSELPEPELSELESSEPGKGDSGLPVEAVGETETPPDDDTSDVAAPVEAAMGEDVSSPAEAPFEPVSEANADDPADASFGEPVETPDDTAAGEPWQPLYAADGAWKETVTPFIEQAQVDYQGRPPEIGEKTWLEASSDDQTHPIADVDAPAPAETADGADAQPVEAATLEPAVEEDAGAAVTPFIEQAGVEYQGQAPEQGNESWIEASSDDHSHPLPEDDSARTAELSERADDDQSETVADARTAADDFGKDDGSGDYGAGDYGAGDDGSGDDGARDNTDKTVVLTAAEASSDVLEAADDHGERNSGPAADGDTPGFGDAEAATVVLTDAAAIDATEEEPEETPETESEAEAGTGAGHSVAAAHDTADAADTPGESSHAEAGTGNGQDAGQDAGDNADRTNNDSAEPEGRDSPEDTPVTASVPAANVTADDFSAARALAKTTDAGTPPAIKIEPVLRPGETPSDRLPAIGTAFGATASGASGTSSTSAFEFKRRPIPDRFVWQARPDGEIIVVSDELATAVGPRAAAISGRKLVEVLAGQGNRDPRPEAALHAGRAFSGVVVNWAVDGSDLRVPVTLAGTPLVSKTGEISYRGFGVCRTMDAFVPESGPDGGPSGDSPTGDRPRQDGSGPDQSGQGTSGAGYAGTDRVSGETSSTKLRGRFGLLGAAGVLATAAVARLTGQRPDQQDEDPKEPEHRATEFHAAEADVATIEADPEANDSQSDFHQSVAALMANAVSRRQDLEPADDADAANAPAEPAKDGEPESGQESAATTAAAGMAAAIAAHKTLRRAPPTQIPSREDIEALLKETGDDGDRAPDDAEATGDDPSDPQKWVNDEQAEAAGERLPVEDDAVPASAGRAHLTKPEEDAFRQIAKELGARFEGDIDRPLPPQPDLHLADDGQLDFIEPPLPGSQSAERRLGATAAQITLPKLLDRLPIGVLVSQGDDIVLVNQAFLEFTGYDSLDEVVDWGGVSGLFADQEIVDAKTAEMRSRAGTDDKHVRIVRKDGVELPVEVLLNTVPWRDGMALVMSFASPNGGAAGRGRTGDEAEALKRQLAELEAVLNTATDGVLILKTDGTVVSANKAAQALFDIDQKAMRGRALADLLASESQDDLAAYIARFGNDGVATILNDGLEVVAKTRSGGRLPLFMTLGRLGEERSDKLCAVLRDLTQWKVAEEELRSARLSAESANAQKSEFLARISHEIRTPLNAIIGFSEVMMDDRLAALSSERRREYLRDIHISGTHIMSLVDDLLDLAKIEAGRMEMNFESVNVAPLIKQCVAIVQAQAIRDKIILRTFVPDGLPHVVADAKSLKQILLNLLSNAVKFNLPGGQVIVSAVYGDSGELTLRVKDTGVGIARKDIPLAMEPFRRLSSASNTSGSGLGLPLSKALVDANRATLSLDSDTNQGTVAEVRFPPTRVLAE